MSASRRRGAVVTAIAALVLLAGLSFAAHAALPDSSTFARVIGLHIAPDSTCVDSVPALIFDNLCPGVVTMARWDALHGRLVVGTKPLSAWAADSCSPTHTPLGSVGFHPPGINVVNVEVYASMAADSSFAGGMCDYHVRLTYYVADSCRAPAGAFVSNVIVGTPPCATCAPVVCAMQPYTITVNGTFPDGCWQLDGLAEVDGVDMGWAGEITVNERRVSSTCTSAPRPFTGSIVMPATGAYLHPLEIVEVRRNTTDSSVVTIGWPSRSFTVSDSCGVPAQPMPVIAQVIIGRQVCDSCASTVCPNVPMNVTVVGFLPNACWGLAGLSLLPTMSPIDRPVVVANFREPCPSGAVCTGPQVPFATSIQLSPGSPGPRLLDVFGRVRSCVDSTLVTTMPSHSYPYTVLDSCVVPPVAYSCVYAFLEPYGVKADSASGCEVTLAPGGRAGIVFAARAQGAPLAGLQGGFVAWPHLHIVSVTPTGVATGLHCVTQAHGDSAVSFVLYADHGAPIPARVPAPVLLVEVVADSALGGATHALVGGGVTSGSDSLGNTVPICPVIPLVVVAARVCFAPPAASCDVNGDGRTDVADLVRMARCWFRPETCPDTLSARPDCTGDGAFHVDDILCCARDILGGGGHDSTAHAATRLRVVLGAARTVDGYLQVPLELSGAGEMNGALLHVTYPADRYEAVPAAVVEATRARRATASASGSEPWLPLVELGGTDVVVGVLRLDTTAPDLVTVPLYFRLRPDAVPGGEVAVDQGSVTGTDGSTLTVDLSGTIAPLTGGGTITRLELLAGPNPSTGATHFAVRLPRAGSVDLSLYDVAGRRVVTLVHGELGAGEHLATWDGSGARSGVYFARLAVDGVVRTSRVVMQLAR